MKFLLRRIIAEEREVEAKSKAEAFALFTDKHPPSAWECTEIEEVVTEVRKTRAVVRVSVQQTWSKDFDEFERSSQGELDALRTAKQEDYTDWTSSVEWSTEEVLQVKTKKGWVDRVE